MADSCFNGGVGFVGLLTLLFITLKLLGKIDWSWIWVLAPLWITTGVVLVVVMVVLSIMLVAAFRQ